MKRVRPYAIASCVARAMHAQAAKRMRMASNSTGCMVRGLHAPPCLVCYGEDNSIFLHDKCRKGVCIGCIGHTVRTSEHPKRVLQRCMNPECTSVDLTSHDSYLISRELPSDLQTMTGNWLSIETIGNGESFECGKCGTTQADLGITDGRRICQDFACRFEACPRCNKAYHDGPCQEETPPMTDDQVLWNLLDISSTLFPVRTGMLAGEDIDRHRFPCGECHTWSMTASACTSHRCGNEQCTRGDARCRWCDGRHHGCAYSADHLRALPKVQLGGPETLTRLLMLVGAGDHQASRPELHARALEMIGHIDDEVTRLGYTGGFIDSFNRVNDATRGRMFDEFNRWFLEMKPGVHERMKLDVPAPLPPGPPPIHTTCAYGFRKEKIPGYIPDNQLLTYRILSLSETGTLQNPRAYDVQPNDFVLIQHNRNATPYVLQILDTAQGRRDALNRPKSVSRLPVLRLVRVRVNQNGHELTETHRRDLQRLLKTNRNLCNTAEMREAFEAIGIPEETINATQIEGRRQFNRRARDAIRELIGGWQDVMIPRHCRNPPTSPMVAQPVVEPVV